MLTLTEYQKLDKDLVMQGLYDFILKADSGFLSKCAVNTIKGNGIKYNVKTARAGISYQDPMDDVPETQPTFTQRSASVYVAIKDSMLSKFAKAVNGTQDPNTLILKSDMEDFSDAVNKMMIVGQTTTTGNTKQPKGMLQLLAEIESEATVDLDSLNNTQVIANHATSGALTLDNLDILIDAVDKPNFLMMSKRSRRKINILARASGSVLKVDQDGFGRFFDMYATMPIWINPNIPDNVKDNDGSSVLAIADYVQATTRAATVDNSPIFCGRNADENGFVINQVEPMSQEDLGTSQKKDATVRRLKWYHGFAIYDKYSLAVLIGSCPTD
jgi:hypothetical protein